MKTASYFNNANLVKYYGDGSTLSNLPTSQWLDIDVGLGYTSIYSAGNVGVDTGDPRYVFQVGGVPYPKLGLNVFQDGVGIEDGNIDASGVVKHAVSLLVLDLALRALMLQRSVLIQFLLKDFLAQLLLMK